MSFDGVVLVDKPRGPSSAEVVDFVRWALGGPPVGHCGTLDPAATGLLVLCVGAATKLAAVLTDADKRYRATFALGRSTTTGDSEGDTVDETAVDAEAVERAAVELPRMVGELSLPPPAWSAIKIGGRRAHALAREGEAVELAPRTMIVRSVEGIERRGTSVVAELEVGKGTYVRSLAEELGRRIGVPVHTSALHRVAAGHLRVDDPRTLAGFDVTPRERDRSGKPRHRLRLRQVAPDRAAQAEAIAAACIDPIEALPLPRIEIADTDAGRECLRRLLNGQGVRAEELGVPKGVGAAAVVAARPRALLLATWADAVLRPTRVVLG